MACALGLARGFVNASHPKEQYSEKRAPVSQLLVEGTDPNPVTQLLNAFLEFSDWQQLCPPVQRRLGVRWVKFNRFSKYANAPLMMPQVTKGATGISEHGGVPAIELECVLDGFHGDRGSIIIHELHISEMAVCEM
jgi:hypothetical protein